MSWINKSLFAWLYYRQRKPERYNNVEDYKQKQWAERALSMVKNANREQLEEAKMEYLKEAEKMIDSIIEEKTKSPKPNKD